MLLILDGEGSPVDDGEGGFFVGDGIPAFGPAGARVFWEDGPGCTFAAAARTFAFAASERDVVAGACGCSAPLAGDRTDKTGDKP